MNEKSKPAFPCEPALAIAHVRWQELCDVYEPEKALNRGTLFPELDKPFYGRRARYGMQNGH
ncbi:MAG: spore coat associated protein CotJA [Clostridia bacterium]|nr:spore coat associated protein CotJA [Clostridia bacterium]